MQKLAMLLNIVNIIIPRNMTGDIALDTAKDSDRKNTLCLPILSAIYPKNGFPMTSPILDSESMNAFQ